MTDLKKTARSLLDEAMAKHPLLVAENAAFKDFLIDYGISSSTSNYLWITSKHCEDIGAHLTRIYAQERKGILAKIASGEEKAANIVRTRKPRSKTLLDQIVASNPDILLQEEGDIRVGTILPATKENP